jgi:pimeloyl-ACP methyl ester carboxylesterase
MNFNPQSAIRNPQSVGLAFDDAGNGEPVVLLHGYPFNRSMWHKQVEVLKETHRVITPDLRGLGESPLTETATMDEMANDVAALLDSLGIEETIIGGLSMGGYVTLAFTRLFPHRVKGLILADTRPQSDTEDGKQNRERHAQLALSKGMSAIAEEMLPKLLAPSTITENPDVVVRVSNMILTTQPQGAANAQRGMAQRVDHTEMLSNINVPTLIIVGSEDVLTPPSDSEKMHEAIKDSLLITIEGAGHCSNLENPEMFNAALVSFLGSLNE